MNYQMKTRDQKPTSIERRRSLFHDKWKSLTCGFDA